MTVEKISGPRSEGAGAAGWDGVERRAVPPRAAVPDRARWSAWLSPERMRGQILTRVAGGLGTMAAVEVARFLADHIEVILH
ncbi:hypothetical protein ACIOJE_27075 [Kitasatospora sp. NPDC087861]|uniref:hypothetical protein n=1 Tax=Kitasatospora sp. NPDC087861 TaxID=3364070 RepID=UPI0038157D00